ncbi:MAG: hypothetical protein INR71_16270 [Terriglobus roseus]|nr:hypothetical protein [Terriglobus roseus]
MTSAVNQPTRLVRRRSTPLLGTLASPPRHQQRASPRGSSAVVSPSVYPVTSPEPYLSIRQDLSGIPEALRVGASLDERKDRPLPPLPEEFSPLSITLQGTAPMPLQYNKPPAELPSILEIVPLRPPGAGESAALASPARMEVGTPVTPTIRVVPPPGERDDMESIVGKRAPLQSLVHPR